MMKGISATEKTDEGLKINSGLYDGW
jgi:hypothetical protein